MKRKPRVQHLDGLKRWLPKENKESKRESQTYVQTNEHRRHTAQHQSRRQISHLHEYNVLSRFDVLKGTISDFSELFMHTSAASNIV